LGRRLLRKIHEGSMRPAFIAATMRRVFLKAVGEHEH
jgi:hypothetical protein